MKKITHNFDKTQSIISKLDRAPIEEGRPPAVSHGMSDKRQRNTYKLAERVEEMQAVKLTWLNQTYSIYITDGLWTLHTTHFARERTIFP